MQGWLLNVLRCWLGAPREDPSSPEVHLAQEVTELRSKSSLSLFVPLPVGTPGHLSDLNPAGLCVGARVLGIKGLIVAQ